MNSTISTGGPTEGLTPIEAERAIYIDFEGTETEPPSFLGAAWADDDGQVRFVQYVLEPALWPAAEAATGVCGGVLMPADWPDLAELRQIAEAEDRRLIAWSDRERKALADCVLDEGDRRWFEDNVLDAKPLAKRWKRRVRPEVDFERDPRNRRRGRHRLDRATTRRPSRSTSAGHRPRGRLAEPAPTTPQGTPGRCRAPRRPRLRTPTPAPAFVSSRTVPQARLRWGNRPVWPRP